MREGQGTRLPEPARQLWLLTREVIRKNLRGLQEAPVEYRFGGGTILAARWLHRESSDIDITVDDDTPLYRLGDPIQSGFEAEVKALGGEPRFFPELNKYKILFDEGEDRHMGAYTDAEGRASTESSSRAERRSCCRTRRSCAGRSSGET